MKSQETKQSEQAHVSAPSESSKDEKQNESCTTAVKYTAEERLLARKYKVEPKLIRMIAEIVGEHTAEFTELIKLRRGEADQKIETKLEEIETPEELQESADETEPTTGIPQLDKLIKETLYESQAMAYVCLDETCQGLIIQNTMRPSVIHGTITESPRRSQSLRWVSLCCGLFFLKGEYHERCTNEM